MTCQPEPTEPPEITDDELRERLFAGRVPGQALTKAQHDVLEAAKGRPLTQDPIGAHKHPAPETPTT